MLRQELESVMERSIDPFFFNQVLEPMYMASDLNKLEFASLLSKEGFDEIQNTWMLRKLLQEHGELEVLRREIKTLRQELSRLKSPAGLPEPEGDEET